MSDAAPPEVKITQLAWPVAILLLVAAALVVAMRGGQQPASSVAMPAQPAAPATEEAALAARPAETTSAVAATGHAAAGTQPAGAGQPVTPPAPAPATESTPAPAEQAIAAPTATALVTGQPLTAATPGGSLGAATPIVTPATSNVTATTSPQPILPQATEGGRAWPTATERATGPSAAPPVTASLAAAASMTPVPCGPVPIGWVRYVVRPGDTLSRLAERAQITVGQLMAANCLSSTLLLAGQNLFLPPLPTPTATPCLITPPADWERYVVRPGDTLSGLALSRGTTVAEISRVNCLASALILVGQSLYLPPGTSVVVPRAAATSGPPAERSAAGTPSACSGFTCRSQALPGLAIRPAEFSGVSFLPCSSHKGRSWISFESEAFGSYDIEHGQRVYFFACEFAAPETLVAEVTGPRGLHLTLPVLPSPPVPGLPMGQAQRLVLWPATCDLPLGSYTLVLRDGQGDRSQISFDVTNARQQRILSIPQAGIPGTTFTVYYCGYASRAGHSILVDLFYQAGPPVAGSYDMRHADSWPVIINSRGWAVQTLPSRPDDQPGAYLLRDRDQALTGQDLIWLLR